MEEKGTRQMSTCRPITSKGSVLDAAIGSLDAETKDLRRTLEGFSQIWNGLIGVWSSSRARVFVKKIFLVCGELSHSHDMTVGTLGMPSVHKSCLMAVRMRAVHR